MRKIIPALWIFLFCAALLPLSVFAGGSQDQSNAASPFDMDVLMGDISGAFAQMEAALSPSALEMTPEDEYFLGRAVAAEILKVYKPYTRNPALTAYLNNICRALAINSSKPSLFSGYWVEILDTGEICAYATPGGHIFISRGLIDCALSEDHLAAVVAHEISHIQLRHMTSIITHERSIQDLMGAAERAATIASRNLTAQERAVLFQESLGVSTNTLFLNGYHKEQEFEADRLARLLLIAAGYNPASLGDLLRILEPRLTSGNMSKTHPGPNERIASLGNLPGNIQTGTGADTQNARNGRFNSVLNRR